jgi:hypothetical protein
MGFKTPALKDSRVNLAREAESKLGYKVLARAIACPGTLLFKLRELGIEPLQTAAVKKYKTSKEHTGMWSGTKWTILFWTLVPCMLTLFVYGMVVNGGPHAPDAFWPWYRYASNILSAIAALGFAITGSVSLDVMMGEGTRKIIRWHSFTLSNYTGNVPEFVLSKAVEIKSALPNCQFEIQQLGTTVNEHHRTVSLLRDPFLVASLDNESYYIDVWDEKEYEASI